MARGTMDSIWGYWERFCGLVMMFSQQKARKGTTVSAYDFVFCFCGILSLLRPSMAVRPLKERPGSWGDEVSFLKYINIYLFIFVYDVPFLLGLGI